METMARMDAGICSVYLDLFWFQVNAGYTGLTFILKVIKQILQACYTQRLILYPIL